MSFVLGIILGFGLYFLINWILYKKQLKKAQKVKNDLQDFIEKNKTM